MRVWVVRVGSGTEDPVNRRDQRRLGLLLAVQQSTALTLLAANQNEADKADHEERQDEGSSH
jgi:hypothetical protein